MTGTAATEGTEFESIYKLKVTIVPTNKPMIRKVCSCMLSVVAENHPVFISRSNHRTWMRNKRKNETRLDFKPGYR